MNSNPYKKIKKTSYTIEIISWKAISDFNTYAFGWDNESSKFNENYYLEIYGEVSESSTRAIEIGQNAIVKLLPSKSWYENGAHTEHLEIGRIIKKTRGKPLTFTLGLPTNSYENIRANLSYKPVGEVGITGTELIDGKAEIFTLTFN